MTYQNNTTESEQAPIATHHIEGYGAYIGHIYSIGFQFLAIRLIHYTIGYNMKLDINWVWSHPKLSHNNLPMQVCSWLPRTYNYVEWVQLISISQVFRVLLPSVHGMSFDEF